MDSSFIYDSVVLIGVDGAGQFFRQAKTPNIDRIFAGGARTDRCLTAIPSISAQCWGSMLIGVTPDVHGISNATIDTHPRTSASPFPSVFRAIREQRPDAKLASFCNWDPISSGIAETDIGIVTATGNDEEVTAKVLSYLASNDPTFLFVHLDDVDEAGHSFGFGTAPEYFAAIENADREIGMIWDAIERKGAADRTLFLIDADHGGYLKNHGGSTDGEKYVTYAARGVTVLPGEICDMEIRDNAAIVLHALGLRQPDTWTARVPSGIFRGVTAGVRPVWETPEEDVCEALPTPDESSLRTVLGEHLAAWLPLDGMADDALGHCSVQTHGKQYYITGRHGSGIRLDDGYLALSGIRTEGSFSVGVWVKPDRNAALGTVFAAGEMRLDVTEDGFVFRFGGKTLHGAARRGSWHNIVCAVDRRVGELRLFIDFHLAEMHLLSEALIEAPLYLGAASGKDRQPLGAVLDEVVLWTYGFREYDAPGLAAHYGVEV